MESVFISSIQEDFAEVRAAARRSVESLGMRPVMAEGAGASLASPQRALLDLVADADVFLLILGPRYSKPTEDEFDEARRRAKPILVLRLTAEAEPEQEEFVDRVAGGWQGGRLWGSFTDASDIGYAVVQALSNQQRESASVDLAPQAQDRAHELALGSQTQSVGEGSTARVVHVPLVDELLLDAVALSRADLGDRVAGLAREHALVPHSVGLDAQISRTGVTLHTVGGYANPAPLLEVGSDGSVTALFNVAGQDQFASMRVDPTRLREGTAAAGAFSLAVWGMIDGREAVQLVAVALAIPDAQHKVFGASTGGSSLQMGSFGMPSTVVVPEPACIVRRAEIGAPELTERLVTEAHRVFADAGAVQE